MIIKEISKVLSTCDSDEYCQNLGSFMNSWNGLKYSLKQKPKKLILICFSIKGIPTGRCVPSSVRNNIKVCEVRKLNIFNWITKVYQALNRLDHGVQLSMIRTGETSK